MSFFLAARRAFAFSTRANVAITPVSGAPTGTNGAPTAVERAPMPVEGAPTGVEGAFAGRGGAPTAVNAAPTAVSGTFTTVKDALAAVANDVRGARNAVVGTKYAAFGLTMMLCGLFTLTTGSAEAQSVAWTQRSNVGPSPRFNVAMAYDSARGVTVLFGGGNPTPNAETWEWNGTTWTQRVVVGASPPARQSHAMAYDSARHVTVLFGGYTGVPNTGEFNNDTWEWNGTVWTHAPVVGPLPTPRGVHAMAYDAARGETVLFGGADGGAVFGDTWAWNGTTWTLRQPSTDTVSCPPPGTELSRRYWHSMSYDSSRNVTVLVGGYDRTCTYGETWEWNGTEWSLRTNGGPSPRAGSAMVFDSDRDVSVMLGGAFPGSGAPSSETWEWSGSGWTQRLVTAPLIFSGHAMAYDTNRHVTVLFGGNTSAGVASGETWEYRTICACLPDINCDGVVNSQDFFEYLGHFFNDGGDLQADFNHDGVVNSSDFFDFLAAFFTGC